jgi:hypothetical protein
MAYDLTKDKIKERIFEALISNELEKTLPKGKKLISEEPLNETQNPLKADVFPAIAQQLFNKGIEVREKEIERLLGETLEEKLSPKKGEKPERLAGKRPSENIERKILLSLSQI